jgi:hypothetical protein
MAVSRLLRSCVLASLALAALDMREVVQAQEPSPDRRVFRWNMPISYRLNAVSISYVEKRGDSLEIRGDGTGVRVRGPRWGTRSGPDLMGVAATRTTITFGSEEFMSLLQEFYQTQFFSFSGDYTKHASAVLGADSTVTIRITRTTTSGFGPGRLTVTIDGWVKSVEFERPLGRESYGRAHVPHEIADLVGKVVEFVAVRADSAESLKGGR